MYHWHTKVRYSEVNEHAKMTVTSLIDHLQDCCTFQSEELGVGVDYLKENSRAWVILGWQIEISRMPGFMEEIDVQTWPYEFKGFYGWRNFRICDREGACIMQANSLWAYMDTQAGRPVRVPQEVGEKYMPMDAPLSMEKPPKKIFLPEEGVLAKEPFAVQRSHLDTNHHVNNGQYVHMAMEYMEAEKKISRIRVVYRHSAVLGDMIYPYVAQGEDCIQVELSSKDRMPYAVVELGWKKEEQ